MKTGRNEPCPCGSGKKFKHCHYLINDGSDSFAKMKGLSFEESVGSYNKFDLIQSIAALQIDECNPGHCYRLERAVQSIARKAKSGTAPLISKEQLEALINNSQEVKSIVSTEDPIENPFTQNCSVLGQNYTVYTGMETGGVVFNVSHLVEALYQCKESIEISKREIVDGHLKSISALLFISNLVAARAGHSWCQKTNRDGEDSIEVDPRRVSSYKEAVTFSGRTIQRILEKLGLESYILDRFITDEQDLECLELDPERHPFQRRPLYHIGNFYILAQPASILTAIRHSIIVLARGNGIFGDLMSAYLDGLSRSCYRSFRMMGYVQEDVPLPFPDYAFPAEEAFYSFDTDKLCYTLLVLENGSDYDNSNPYGSNQLEKENAAWIQKRVQEISDSLRENAKHKNKSLFCVVLVGSIGRRESIGIDRVEGTKLLMLSPDELSVIALRGDVDALTLWKYTEAVERLREKTHIASWSFLDTFAMYWKHRAFYFSDEFIPNFITVNSDFQRPLREEIARKRQIHYALYHDNLRMVLMCKRHFDDDARDFFVLSQPNLSECMIELNGVRVWVTSKELRNEFDQVNHTARLLVEALGNWVARLISDFGEKVIVDFQIPVSIKLVIDDPKSWLEKMRLSRKLEGHEDIVRTINTETDPDTFSVFVHLNSGFVPHLSRKDNVAEIELVRNVLHGIKTLQINNKVSNGLDENDIENFVKENAAVKSRKHISIFSSPQQMILDDVDLPKLRFVQLHDQEEELEDLGHFVSRRLGQEKYTPIEISGDYRLLTDAVFDHFLNRIKTQSIKLDRMSTLNQFLHLNEALIRERELWHTTAAHNVHNSLDFKSKVKTISRMLGDIDQTAVPLRFLIEFFHSEPISGDENASDYLFDKLLAASSELVNWGFIRDYVRCEVMQHRFSLLETGRIGISNRQDSRIDEFRFLKTLETVDDQAEAINRSAILSPKHSGGETELDNHNGVFEAEFGLTIENMLKFAIAMTSSAFGKGQSVVPASVDEIISELGLKFELQAEVCIAGLRCFTLPLRLKWEVVPEGFTQRDIEPWHFSRELSLARRPILALDNTSSTHLPFSKVIFGARQVHASIERLIGSVYSDRFATEKCVSDEMKKFIGSLREKNGAEFEEKVFALLKNEFGLAAKRGVFIHPNGPLFADKDLGDIDVFAADEKNRIAYMIECADINFGRSPSEVSGEIKSLFIAKKDKESKSDKVLKRLDWMRRNWSKAVAYFGLAKGKWKLLPVIVVSRELSSVYLTGHSLQVFSFAKLRRDGILAFGDATSLSTVVEEEPT